MQRAKFSTAGFSAWAKNLVGFFFVFFFIINFLRTGGGPRRFFFYRFFLIIGLGRNFQLLGFSHRRRISSIFFDYHRLQKNQNF